MSTRKSISRLTRQVLASGSSWDSITGKPSVFPPDTHNHTGVYQPVATGTPDGTKYLRDDNSWQAVAGGSGLSQQQVEAIAFLGI